MSPEINEYLVKTLTLDMYLLGTFTLALLAIRTWCWPSKPQPGQQLPASTTAWIVLAAIAVPVSYPFAVRGWEALGELRQADILSIVHLAIVLYVVLLQALVLIGWLLGWRWVRGFWLRLTHLACIVVVAGQPVGGQECFITTWERELRGGDLANLDGSWPLARWANRANYTPVESLKPYLIGYSTFGLIALASWLIVRPELGADYSGKDGHAGTSV
jgi:hypothetical protein